MWKKEEIKPQGVPEKPVVQSNPPAFSNASPATSSFQPAPSAPSAVSAARSSASIGQGIRIKGEVTGSEDLYVDGVVDGQLNLTNGSLTIGPNGTVKADITAREVSVRGRVDGKVTGRDRVHLSSTAQVTGEVQTDRLAIDEGALLRGRVEAGKVPAKTTEVRSAAMGGSKSSEVPAASGSAAD
jgi:cytoskeletal protein CcmA (bactofilin family)